MQCVVVVFFKIDDAFVENYLIRGLACCGAKSKYVTRLRIGTLWTLNSGCTDSGNFFSQNLT